MVGVYTSEIRVAFERDDIVWRLGIETIDGEEIGR